MEDQYNKMIGSDNNKAKLQPVLPNLVTSTDEVTVFATLSVIRGKENFYLVAKPSQVKNEASHSGCRNNYKRSLTGDAHCRGL